MKAMSSRRTINRRRHSVALPAQCRTLAGVRTGGQIADISQDGCSIVIDHAPFGVVARLIVRPEGMDALTGVVRWIRGREAGVEFDRKLYPATLDRIVATGRSGPAAVA